MQQDKVWCMCNMSATLGVWAGSSCKRRTTSRAAHLDGAPLSCGWASGRNWGRWASTTALCLCDLSSLTCSRSVCTDACEYATRVVLHACIHSSWVRDIDWTMQQFPALAYAVRCVLLRFEDAVMLVNTQKEAIEWCSIPACTSHADSVYS